MSTNSALPGGFATVTTVSTPYSELTSEPDGSGASRNSPYVVFSRRMADQSSGFHDEQVRDGQRATRAHLGNRGLDATRARSRFRPGVGGAVMRQDARASCRSPFIEPGVAVGSPLSSSAFSTSVTCLNSS